MTLVAQVKPEQCPKEDTSKCYFLFHNLVRPEFIEEFMNAAYPGLEYDVKPAVFEYELAKEDTKTGG